MKDLVLLGTPGICMCSIWYQVSYPWYVFWRFSVNAKLNLLWNIYYYYTQIWTFLSLSINISRPNLKVSFYKDALLLCLFYNKFRFFICFSLSILYQFRYLVCHKSFYLYFISFWLYLIFSTFPPLYSNSFLPSSFPMHSLQHLILVVITWFLLLLALLNFLIFLLHSQFLLCILHQQYFQLLLVFVFL